MNMKYALICIDKYGCPDEVYGPYDRVTVCKIFVKWTLDNLDLEYMKKCDSDAATVIQNVKDLFAREQYLAAFDEIKNLEDWYCEGYHLRMVPINPSEKVDY